MSPRATLPGADELFRATASTPEPERGPVQDAPSQADQDVSDATHNGPVDHRTRRTVRRGGGTTSGRERHDEKITVYVSAAELVDLEQARLSLRAEHGIAVDRGRIVREALAVVLADLEAKHGDSILVRRLGAR
ncbi:MAG TPA: cobyrinic acid a,c-diamide synthase [Mycobacteriales bacterium]